jgi:hypothetical protein
MNRQLADLRLAVMMLDGTSLHGYTNIVALGITTEGEKLALGLWDGSSEAVAQGFPEDGAAIGRRDNVCDDKSGSPITGM